MKLYLLALFVVLTGASFLDFLTSLQSHHSFQRLPSADKLLFGELVVAAENNELTEFIDRVGLADVLRLMDHMSQYDAEKFAAYLAEHTNYTHHAPGHGDVINKREDHHDHHGSFFSYLQSLHSSYYQRLPDQEKATYNGLMRAAQDKQLTQFIDTVGYGAVFGLVEQLDSSHAYQVTQMIEMALAAEAAPAKAKRQGNSESHNHHSNFYHYLEGLNTQYYQNLPAEEQKIYNDLMAATKAGNLTGYISANGYGPIFGFLEHLDYVHANQAYDYLIKALESEAAAQS